MITIDNGDASFTPSDVMSILRIHDEQIRRLEEIVNLQRQENIVLRDDLEKCKNEIDKFKEVEKTVSMQLQEVTEIKKSLVDLKIKFAERTDNNSTSNSRSMYATNVFGTKEERQGDSTQKQNPNKNRCKILFCLTNCSLTHSK